MRTKNNQAKQGRTETTLPATQPHVVLCPSASSLEARAWEDACADDGTSSEGTASHSHVEPVLPDHAILEEPATTLFRDTVKSLVEQLMPRVERDLGWAASTHWSSVRSSHTGDVEDCVQPLCFRDMCTQCTEDIDNHSSMCTGNTPPMQMCSTVEVEIRKQLARLQPVASMEGGTAVRPNSNLPG